MSPLCWHCGTPTRANAFIATTPQGPQPACCPGCSTAIETVYGLGLADYYAFRDHRAPRPDQPLDTTTLALFDIPELLQPNLKVLAYGERLTLQLSGLRCAACCWLIEKIAREQPQVRSAYVNLATMRLTVDFNGAAQARDMASAIGQLGYGVNLPGDLSVEKKQKRERQQLLGRLAVAALGAMQAMMYSAALYLGMFEGQQTAYQWLFRSASLLIATPVVFYSGWPFLRGAVMSLRSRHLTMDVPIALALLMAWLGSVVIMFSGGQHVYFDSAAMLVTFLLASRWLELRQRQRIQHAFRLLEDTLPRAVRRLDSRGDEAWVTLRQVDKGDCLYFQQGDVIAVDGVVENGGAELEEAALTGESLPVKRQPGDAVIAASRLLAGNLWVRATSAPSDSMVAQLTEQVTRAQREQSELVSNSQRLIPGFVTTVMLLAVLTFVLHWQDGTIGAFEHTLAVLVITCPCALALAVPLTLSATLSAALRANILIASPKQLLRLSRVRGILFDKTGTLTSGKFSLREVLNLSTESTSDLLAIAAALEQGNRHPVAHAFREIRPAPDIQERQFAADGVSGRQGDIHWRLTADASHARAGTTCLQLDADGTIKLRLWLSDTMEPDVLPTLRALHRGGLKLRLASGDSHAAVATLAARLPFLDWRAEQTPDQKAQWIASLEQQEGAQLMVGDGINDARAMVSASASVATANATNLAQSAAGIYLLSKGIKALPALPDLSRLCRRTITQNVAWALLYNLIAVPFAMMGLIPPWAAALGMSFSSLFVTINASRITRWKLSFS